MNHRLSLGNFEPRRYNVSKEKIFVELKRDPTPNWRRKLTPKPNREELQDDIIQQFQTLPELNLERREEFFDKYLKSKADFCYQAERQTPPNPYLNGQQRIQRSRSPINRIQDNNSRSPNRLSACFLESHTSKQFNELKTKINSLGQWQCLINQQDQINVCRVTKQEEIYILKGFENKKPFTNKQIDEQIKQHLLAQSLLQTFYKLFEGIKLPHFQFSNILLFQKVGQDEFWLAERKQTSELTQYNLPDGQIYKDKKTDNINSDFLNTFSYYTYRYSNAKYMILNIKGFGSYLTEPQIKLASQRQARNKFLSEYLNKKNRYQTQVDQMFSTQQ